MSKWAIRSKKRAICSFAHFLGATWANRAWSLIFVERPERFADIANYLWATDLTDWLTSLIKKEGISKSLAFLNLQKTYKKHIKNMILVIFFWANRLFFVSKRANEWFAQKNERFAHLIIYHEQPERIAHSCSWSDLSELLTVAHLIWANERWSNEWIPNPIGAEGQG